MYTHIALVIPEEPEDSLDIVVDRPMERIEHEKEREKGKERGREMERGRERSIKMHNSYTRKYFHAFGCSQSVTE